MGVHAAVAGVFFALGLGIGLWSGASGAILTRSAAFFALCQATLRVNADVIRLRISDRRIIVVSFALAALGFALVAADAGFPASVAGFAVIGFGTGAIAPCSFALAARQSPGRPAVGLSSASLFSALTRLPAPLATGAIAQNFSLPAAFGAFAVALAAAGLSMSLFGPADGDASPAAKE
jgi:MFS family permease